VPGVYTEAVIAAMQNVKLRRELSDIKPIGMAMRVLLVILPSELPVAIRINPRKP
jgi:hypothetical protein